jgi:hypothetical protein
MEGALPKQSRQAQASQLGFVFHANVFSHGFPSKKWALKRIDKIRRGFLWKGEEGANGGHCLVRWTLVKRPNKLGGLGVLDLERFSRALRLRWLWFRWSDPDRPWVGSEAPCNEDDKQLFRASTVVTIGDGCWAEFWESAWLEGRAPRDIAPSLFKLAWRKHQTVPDDLNNNNWTRGLRRMTTTQQMAEFISLWSMLDQVVLSD